MWQKQTETDRNGQKWSVMDKQSAERDKNRLKLKKTDKNRDQPTEMNRN